MSTPSKEVQDIGDGNTFTFHPVGNDKKAVDLDRPSGRVQCWTFTTQTNQLWKLELIVTGKTWPQYKLKNVATNTYLEDNGGSVTAQPGVNHNRQTWRFLNGDANGKYLSLQNVGSGKFLEFNTTDGAPTKMGSGFYPDTTSRHFRPGIRRF